MRALEAAERILVAPELVERDAAVAPGDRIGIERERAVVELQRLGEAAERGQGVGLVGERDGELRVARQRTVESGERFGRPAEPVERHAEKIVRERVRGLGLDQSAKQLGALGEAALAAQGAALREQRIALRRGGIHAGFRTRCGGEGNCCRGPREHGRNRARDSPAGWP